MEKNIVAHQFITAIGIVDLIAKTKSAEKEGWVLYGNPMMTGNVVNQGMVKYKEEEVSK